MRFSPDYWDRIDEARALGFQRIVERRHIGLQRSIETKQYRADLRRRLRERDLTFAALYDLALTDKRVGRMLVGDCVKQVVGVKAAPVVLEQVGVVAERRLHQLGWAQRDRLVDALD